MLYIINEVSDPYEPSNCSAICTSMEEIMKLGLKDIWQNDEDSNGNWKCTNLVTGEIKLVDRYGFPPSPYISTMEVNKYYPMNGDLND